MLARPDALEARLCQLSSARSFVSDSAERVRSRSWCRRIQSVRLIALVSCIVSGQSSGSLVCSLANEYRAIFRDSQSLASFLGSHRGSLEDVFEVLLTGPVSVLASEKPRPLEDFRQWIDRFGLAKSVWERLVEEEWGCREQFQSPIQWQSLCGRAKHFRSQLGSSHVNCLLSCRGPPNQRSLRTRSVAIPCNVRLERASSARST